MRAAVALGANLGDRLGFTLTTRAPIIRLSGGVRAISISSALYETEPIECEPGAKKFFNAVMELGLCR